jgi:hypothetical protein
MKKSAKKQKPIRYRRIKEDTVNEIRSLACNILHQYCECDGESCCCAGSSDSCAEEILRLLPLLKAAKETKR